MKIQILGTGCSRCHSLRIAAEIAVQELGIVATVEKVTDIAEMLEFSPLALPALAVDGKVKSAGHVLTIKQIKSYLTEEE